MKTGMTADAALVASGQADADTVQAGVREQAFEIIASVLGWEDVVVRYYAGEGLLGRGLDAAMEIPSLLTGAARRAASGRSSALTSRGLVMLPESGLTLAMKLPLDPVEAFACSLVQQPVAVEDFLNLMPPGTTAPGEVLLRLVFLGLLRVQPAQAPAPVAQQDDSAAGELEELLRRFEIADYYEILSLPGDAGQDEIKEAYHNLARRYHPDLFQADRFGADLRQRAERLFTYITAAYTTLTNSASRSAYDEQRSGRKLDAALQARAGADMDKEKASAALYRVGQKALLDKDLEKAVMTLGECVFLRPDVARYRRALGCAQAEMPRYQKEAEQNLLKAIELDPMALESYVALGKLYMKVKLTRRAEAQFRHVLRWDPGNAEAARRLEELARVPK
jgi:tetratricopeptide (TPR) repeat protein